MNDYIGQHFQIGGIAHQRKRLVAERRIGGKSAQHTDQCEQAELRAEQLPRVGKPDGCANQEAARKPSGTNQDRGDKTIIISMRLYC